MKQQLIDHVELCVRAGNGGKGSLSFRREKYIPKGGPDGGDGGNGGSIYFQANPHITTLLDYAGKDRFEAVAGGDGRFRQQHGRNASDLTLDVPVGTIIWAKKPVESASDNTQEFIPREKVTKTTVTKAVIKRHKLKYSDEWEKVVDLNEPGMTALVARGGAGGRGNTAFKSSVNTTPMYAEAGHWGEEKFLRLELKILADVGLVGLPNAGKSTLLSILTAARPEIADYPFTTINPNLGVLEGQNGAGEKRSVVVADIPGLIEDAHKGKGLGVEFLRHIERCRTLVYVISPEGKDLELISNDQFPISSLVDQFNTVRNEVLSYGHDVDQKPRIVVINKTDVMTEKMILGTVSAFKKLGETVIAVSAATTDHIAELKKLLLS